MTSRLDNGRPAWTKWYKTTAWSKLRLRQLKREPLCRFCRKYNQVTAANTVDHIMPHKGEMTLFFDPANLQSLCKSCHSSKKQRLEKSGKFGCDERGFVPAWQEKE